MDTNTDTTLNSITAIAAGKPGRTRKAGVRKQTATISSPPSRSQLPSTPAQSKSATVVKLLSRGRGASGVELAEATGWQPHTVRAYLSGLRKRARRLSAKPGSRGETGYRIVAGAVVANDIPGEQAKPTAVASSPSSGAEDARAIDGGAMASPATTSADQGAVA